MARKIPTKNYLIVLGMIILIISACFAIYNLKNIYHENKITKSVFSKNSIKYEDLGNITKDMSADTFLIIGYTQDSKVYQNEKEIKQLLKKQNLLDHVLYLDMSEKKNEDNYLEDLNVTLKLEGINMIKSIPALVFYHEGEVTKVVSEGVRKDDIAQIIDMYSLAG